eukprot:CAMPEP_0204299950 /NCGR_PEP_ID=MMETSP0468-20130131/77709_1 /ASSEMBLY_ACC=CAM_ASM_000383 /TAXON_ID=2969 /ORGANISM="Oxyrrhis marina" /LENGTH=48 /DNA_ID= /DNA_START= /DNA_END= /DNA_ORIENTATION=
MGSDEGEANVPQDPPYRGDGRQGANSGRQLLMAVLEARSLNDRILYLH